MDQANSSHVQERAEARAPGQTFTLRERAVELANGRTITFRIATQPNTPSYFLLGVKKSGSSLLNSMAAAIAQDNGYAMVDVAGTFFNQNVVLKDWMTDPAVSSLLAGGNLYGGFRSLPTYLATTNFFKNQTKLLMVRDPRDAVVSEYFSLAYSHSIPATSEEGGEVSRRMASARERMQATDLDTAVLQLAPGLNKVLNDYIGLIVDPKTRILRYEDVILDKPRMIQEIADQFGWTITQDQIKRILNWADVVPTEENKHKFVRKVVPGDHREKLSAATIASLNATFSKAMAAFGYQ